MTTSFMGTSEIAQYLGISRQRVDQIVREEPSFPRAAATLQSGRIWERAGIEAWAEATGRIPAATTVARSEVLGNKAEAATQACFVIGPIGNKFAPMGSIEKQTHEEALQIWEEVIKPACEAVGLEPVRADGLSKAGEITEQVFRRLHGDPVVIADLTGANPNVMYELGLRHTRDLLTVQIGEYGRLPFDLAAIRTVMFSRSPHGLVSARNELTEILGSGLEGGYDPVTATRIWTTGSEVNPPPSTQSERDDVPPEDPLGWADVIAEGEAALESISETAESLTELTKDLGAMAERATEDLHKSDAAGKGMRGRLAVFANYAHQLEEFVPRTKSAADRFENEIRQINAMFMAMIDRFEEDPSQLNHAEAGKARWLAQVVRTSLATFSEMVESMKDNAKLSRVMVGPTKRITSEFDRMLAAAVDVDEWDRRLQALGVPVLAEDAIED